MFLKAIQDEHEIQRLHKESQARRREEIAYELRREVDWSSKHATRGIEISFNSKFSSNGGILDEDYSRTRSIREAKFVFKIAPAYIGSRKDNVLFNGGILTRLIDAGNGIAFIPWCSGRIIRGHGKGILVKFDRFMYLNTSKTFAVMPVI